MNGSRQPVKSFRNKDDSVMDGFLRAIDRLLKRIGIIARAIGVRAEILGSQINSMRIIWPRTVNGLRESATGKAEKYADPKDDYREDIVRAPQSNPTFP
jgi:hypothetical protein